MGQPALLAEASGRKQGSRRGVRGPHDEPRALGCADGEGGIQHRCGLGFGARDKRPHTAALHKGEGDKRAVWIAEDHAAAGGKGLAEQAGSLLAPGLRVAGDEVRQVFGSGWRDPGR